MAMDSVAIEQQGKPQCTEQSRDVTELVMADLEMRRRMGIQKYGVALKTFNGRKPLVDAYQEALDLCVYLRQALSETQDSGQPQADHAGQLFDDMLAMGIVEESERYMAEFIFRRHLASALMIHPLRSY